MTNSNEHDDDNKPFESAPQAGGSSKADDLSAQTPKTPASDNTQSEAMEHNAQSQASEQQQSQDASHSQSEAQPQPQPQSQYEAQSQTQPAPEYGAYAPGYAPGQPYYGQPYGYTQPQQGYQQGYQPGYQQVPYGQPYNPQYGQYGQQGAPYGQPSGQYGAQAGSQYGNPYGQYGQPGGQYGSSGQYWQPQYGQPGAQFSAGQGSAEQGNAGQTNSTQAGSQQSSSNGQHSYAGFNPFKLIEEQLPKRAITTVRVVYAIVGVVALLAGMALMIAPAKTLAFAALALGIYFLVSGAVRVISAFAEPNLPAGWRVLDILVGVLLAIGGVFVVKNWMVSGQTLAILVTLFVGMGWITEGIMSLVESWKLPHSGWAIASAIISIVAGVVVLFSPLSATVFLVIFGAIALVAMGVTSLVRAFTFGSHNGKSELR